MEQQTNSELKLLQSVAGDQVSDFAQLSAQCLADRLQLIVLECNEVKTKQQILSKIAQAYDFPADFGHNFDALYDAMTDLILIPGNSGFVLVLQNVTETAQFTASDRATLFAVLADVADFWDEQEMSFKAFYSLKE